MVVLSPPQSYLSNNPRPHCSYENNDQVIKCLESYKELANLNDEDKESIRDWIDLHTQK